LPIHSPILLFLLPLIFYQYPATHEFYTLSLHDALPIWCEGPQPRRLRRPDPGPAPGRLAGNRGRLGPRGLLGGVPRPRLAGGALLVVDDLDVARRRGRGSFRSPAAAGAAPLRHVVPSGGSLAR